MPQASTTLHEPAEKLKTETINFHRAMVSLMEELEAIDWYRQRAEACTDPQLRAILEHNMNEEIEHASMALEWIRRNVPKFDEALKTYLFTSGEITELEGAATSGEKPSAKAIRPNLRTTVGHMKGSNHD
ncbi:MAG TPA: ferritin-like domain-containing protein [Candidatus Binatia bacterium]|nr:ferritin-like domain-containing protein [Candidatus Binatia bacterium]